jgi:hypothetical protein
MFTTLAARASASARSLVAAGPVAAAAAGLDEAAGCFPAVPHPAAAMTARPHSTVVSFFLIYVNTPSVEKRQ